MRIHRLFMNKANRDAEFARLGGAKAGLKRGSSRNQLIHPGSVEDYTKETGRTLAASDYGFGNGVYRTAFSALYKIESVNPYYGR